MYADQAWGKAPDHGCAKVALGLALVEAAALSGFTGYGLLQLLLN